MEFLGSLACQDLLWSMYGGRKEMLVPECGATQILNAWEVPLETEGVTENHTRRGPHVEYALDGINRAVLVLRISQ